MSLRQIVDSTLSVKLADIFEVKSFEVNLTNDKATKSMRPIFVELVNSCIIRRKQAMAQIANACSPSYSRSSSEVPNSGVFYERIAKQNETSANKDLEESLYRIPSFGTEVNGDGRIGSGNWSKVIADMESSNGKKLVLIL